MKRLLEEGFSKISGLPESEQDDLARTLLELASADGVRAIWANHGL